MTISHQPILDGVDPDIMDRLVSRRDAIKRGAAVSSTVAAGLAMGSAPVLLAALSKDVFAQTPSAILDVLNFAFILENLDPQIRPVSQPGEKKRVPGRRSQAS